VTRLLRQPGQPFADSSLFAVDAVSELMRRHVTVALSGDGGDEGFGGYDVYWRLGVIDRLQVAPPFVWRTAARAAGPLGRAGLVRPTLGNRLRDLTGADDVSVLQTMFSWIRADEQRELLADVDGVEPARRLFEPQWQHLLPPGSTRLDRLTAQAVEVNIRLILANDFLSKVDTASMRHSLEVRVPMLDEDVIDFGLTLPQPLRVSGRTGKPVLRTLASRHLPQPVVEKKKQGFAIPVDRWVDGTFRRNLRETLLDRDTRIAQVFDKKVYGPWVEAFCGNGTHPRLNRGGLHERLIMLLALELSLDDTGTRA